LLYWILLTLILNVVLCTATKRLRIKGELVGKIGEVCSEVARLDPELGGLCEELRLAVEALELEASGLEPEEVYAMLRGRAL
jgi:hypothetical protein